MQFLSYWLLIPVWLFRGPLLGCVCCRTNEKKIRVTRHFRNAYFTRSRTDSGNERDDHDVGRVAVVLVLAVELGPDLQLDGLVRAVGQWPVVALPVKVASNW